jgi:hypothetical protein
MVITVSLTPSNALNPSVSLAIAETDITATNTP